MVRLKQAADLHSCRISQRLILSLLQQDNDREQKLIDFYTHRRDSFEQSLKIEFGDLADWQQPIGGLFFWLTLRPEYAVDTRDLLRRSIDQGVAFMPGESFFPKGVKAQASLRLNFSHASPSAAKHGLQTLAKIIRRSRE